MNLPVRTFRVVALPHPLKPRRVEFHVGEGRTLEDAILLAAHYGDTRPAMLARAVVIRGDVSVAKVGWHAMQPRAGEDVVIKALPGDPITLTALITSVAAYGVPTALGLTGFTALAVSAGITLIGGLIGMALTPTPRQSNFGQRLDDGTPLRSIQGVRNQLVPYGTIPRVFGRVRNYYPPLAAQPYTEVWRGNDQYFRAVFLISYGPCEISRLVINNTSADKFEDIEYEVFQGRGADPRLRLFPAQVREEVISIELKQSNGWHVRTSEPNSDEIALDVAFPNGLQRISNKQITYWLEVEFEVQYRAAGATTWLAAPLSPDSRSVDLTGAGRFAVRVNSKAGLRRSVRWVLPTRGQYDVRIRRLTTDNQADAQGKDQSVTVEASYWTSLRSSRHDHPVNVENVTLLAMRVRTTEQFSGQLDQVSCTVEALLPVWDGAEWTETKTRNPAWAAAEVMRGSANARPLDDSRIDLDSLLEFASYCTSKLIDFDGVYSSRVSVFEALQDILGTANSALSMAGGLFSVVVDKQRSSVVQHFTPRNSRNLTARRDFARPIHGVRVWYADERSPGQMAEFITYANGYDADNATEFQRLELPWTTSYRSAWRRARRALYTWTLRPWTYSLEVDAEHLVCVPGDLVRVTHDVLLWGLGSARVKSVTESLGLVTHVEVDAALAMTAAGSYGFRFRRATGATVTAEVVSDDGEFTTFELATPAALGIAPGDLAMFGEYGDESVELLVRSVEPRSNLAATLTFVDYAPEIFNADDDPVPDFDPQITLPPPVNRTTPAPPQILSVDSGSGTLVRNSDGTVTSRILVGFTVNQSLGDLPAEAIQARFREAATLGDWAYAPTIPALAGAVSIGPVQDATEYAIEIRSVAAAGAVSRWIPTTHVVVGKVEPPPDVERIYRKGNALVWPYPDPPPDLAGFVVRAHYGTSEDVATARRLHLGVLTVAEIDISALSGVHRVFVNAIDTSRIESAAPASILLNLGDLSVSNIVDTQSEAPTFAGEIAGGTVSGGVLQADVVASPPFYRAGSMYPADTSDPMYPATSYEALQYVATWTPASDQLDDAKLMLDLDVEGEYLVEFRIATSPDFYPSPDSTRMYPADTSEPMYGDVTVTEWAPWPGELGPFDTVDDTYEIRISVAVGTTRGEINQFDLVVDVPDIVERFTEVEITSASSGVRLTPAAARRVIDYVTFGAATGSDLAYLRIIDRNPTLGPLIKGYDIADAETTGIFDATMGAH